MIPLKEAQSHVFERVTPLRAMALPLDECLGLATSQAVHSEESIPPFDNTAVDGFALRFDEVSAAAPENPVTLPVAGTIAAGDPPRVLPRGAAMRIMTGAVIPSGANAVIMVEDTEEAEGGVRVLRTVRQGENIRLAGSDITAGALLFAERTVLGPAHLGVLASAGYVKAPVHRRARVGVISTGSELVDEARALRPGEIRDSNRHSLRAILSTTGADVVDLGIVPDDEEALRSAFLSAAAELDAIVTSGGVSVGDFDYTKKVLRDISKGEMRWMQVAIRPAKPFAFGLVEGIPLFGLPGNPVSALVSFELFVRPAIRKMHGHSELFDPTLMVRAANTYRRHPDGRVHYARALLVAESDGSLSVSSLEGQSSHMLHEMARSNALAICPDGDGYLLGDMVEVMPLGPATPAR